MKNRRLNILKLSISIIPNIHNGLNIRNRNPTPEPIPCIFPDLVSFNPFRSSAKIPAIMQPTPKIIIPNMYNMCL